jgi:hypothetical protein
MLQTVHVLLPALGQAPGVDGLGTGESSSLIVDAAIRTHKGLEEYYLVKIRFRSK